MLRKGWSGEEEEERKGQVSHGRLLEGSGEVERQSPGQG
jgi:hypothetical protein